MTFDLNDSGEKHVEAIIDLTSPNTTANPFYVEFNNLSSIDLLTPESSASGSGFNPKKNSKKSQSVDLNLSCDNEGFPKIGFNQLEDVVPSQPGSSHLLDYDSQTARKVQTNQRNVGTTGEYDGFSFPQSREVLAILKQKFGLDGFRPN